ncbi:unnamed protein product [Gadus morhua 'NCC']
MAQRTGSVRIGWAAPPYCSSVHTLVLIGCSSVHTLVLIGCSSVHTLVLIGCSSVHTLVIIGCHTWTGTSRVASSRTRYTDEEYRCCMAPSQSTAPQCWDGSLLAHRSLPWARSIVARDKWNTVNEE